MCIITYQMVNFGNFGPSASGFQFLLPEYTDNILNGCHIQYSGGVSRVIVLKLFNLWCVWIFKSDFKWKASVRDGKTS